MLLAGSARDLRIGGIAHGEDLDRAGKQSAEVLAFASDDRERYGPGEVMRERPDVGADPSAVLKLAPGEHHPTGTHRRAQTGRSRPAASGESPRRGFHDHEVLREQATMLSLEVAKLRLCAQLQRIDGGAQRAQMLLLQILTDRREI